MDRDLIAKRRAHDADAQPQVARGADVQAVAREEGAKRARRENAVVVALLDQPVRKRDILGVLQHLVAAAARLDAARDRQVAVALQKEAARKVRALAAVQPGAHSRDLRQRRFDEAAVLRSLGKYLFDKGGKALQARFGIVHLRARERQSGKCRGRGLRRAVQPDALDALLHRKHKFLMIQHDASSPVPR